MIAPASARDVGLRTPYDGCAFVDDLGAWAVGELVVNGADGPRGTVFVERGRICWAAARGLAPRLTELLGARAALTPTEMEALFLACKQQRIPLGEHLVARGVLDPTELRAALLQHTIESLRHLCTAESRGKWCPRVGNGYSPRFTFATSELLAEIGASSHAAIADRVRPILEGSFDEGGWAAAFVRSAACAYPEPILVHGSVPHAATMLVRFGKWAASALDIASAFTDEAAVLSVARQTSTGAGSLVAFRHQGAVVTGQTGPHGAARILNQRAQERRRRDRENADL